MLAAGFSAALVVPAIGGPEPVSEPAPAPANNGDWCEWLQNKPGKLPIPENPFLQEFQLEGRLQFQMAYMDGEDVNGDDFSSRFNEFRRARLGFKTKFLQYFGAKLAVDLVDDQRKDAEPNSGLGWGYEQLDEAYLSFDIKKAFGAGPLDSLQLLYGRQKFVLGYESHTSSTKLLTVERSAIANKVYDSARPTGVTLEGEWDKWSFAASVYSSTTDGADNKAFNGWQDDLFYLTHLGYQATDDLAFGFDWTYNHADVSAGEDSVLPYAWATSFNVAYEPGPWGVIGDFIYGDNGGARLGNPVGERDDFWGIVVMPHYWIVDEKLQAVAQYQYGGADDAEGIRVNSRYGRARGTGGTSTIDVNSGRETPTTRSTAV